MSSHLAVEVYAEVQAARGVSARSPTTEAAHEETPRQRGGGGGNHQAQQPEGDLRVDAVDHPPEFMPKNPVMNVSGTKMVATMLTR